MLLWTLFVPMPNVMNGVRLGIADLKLGETAQLEEYAIVTGGVKNFHIV